MHFSFRESPLETGQERLIVSYDKQEIGEIITFSDIDYRWSAANPTLLIPRSLIGLEPNLEEAKAAIERYTMTFINMHFKRRNGTVEASLSRFCHSGYAVKISHEGYQDHPQRYHWCAKGWLDKYDRRRYPDFVASGYDHLLEAILALEISLENLQGKFRQFQPTNTVEGWSELDDLQQAQ